MSTETERKGKAGSYNPLIVIYSTYVHFSELVVYSLVYVLKGFCDSRNSKNFWRCPADLAQWVEPQPAD